MGGGVTPLSLLDLEGGDAKFSMPTAPIKSRLQEPTAAGQRDVRDFGPPTFPLDAPVDLSGLYQQLYRRVKNPTIRLNQPFSILNVVATRVASRQVRNR